MVCAASMDKENVGARVSDTGSWLSSASTVCSSEGAFSSSGEDSQRFSSPESTVSNQDTLTDTPSVARTSGMHIMPVPEDAESVWPADPALIPHTPKMCTRDSEGPRVPMTPGDPVPEKLMGLRMSWINKLEKKTEKVIRVINMQDSPEKEHELERRPIVRIRLTVWKSRRRK
ncbi:MAG: hypothetical protein ACPIOQ_37180 [Promethearchaeia archaeon]